MFDEVKKTLNFNSKLFRYASNPLNTIRKRQQDRSPSRIKLLQGLGTWPKSSEKQLENWDRKNPPKVQQQAGGEKQCGLRDSSWNNVPTVLLWDRHSFLLPSVSINESG